MESDSDGEMNWSLCGAADGVGYGENPIFSSVSFNLSWEQKIMGDAGHDDGATAATASSTGGVVSATCMGSIPPRLPSSRVLRTARTAAGRGGAGGEGLATAGRGGYDGEGTSATI